MIAPDRRFVYIIQSDRNRMRYVGSTSDVARRVSTRNSGGSEFTSPHRPWSVLVSIEFRSEQMALGFERYLKTGSGRAFAKRHFTWDCSREVSLHPPGSHPIRHRRARNPAHRPVVHAAEADLYLLRGAPSLG